MGEEPARRRCFFLHFFSCPYPCIADPCVQPKLKTAAASGSMGKGGVVGQSSKPRKGGGNDFKRKKGKQRA